MEVCELFRTITPLDQKQIVSSFESVCVVSDSDEPIIALSFITTTPSDTHRNTKSEADVWIDTFTSRSSKRPSSTTISPFSDSCDTSAPISSRGSANPPRSNANRLSFPTFITVD
ncbi:hypothetical protein BLNAU_23612 [Blattamonas nauphoetae]|uniref:Uncharacterized protein n=1 Tax=Blattamonas nauphoetae TaxID=2049346 RepID=A0ABQ9WPR1_9EUKA|nr:hypothetical protein BLNAU_23671 [Blattamonas nauphoetae]KAK2941465.1 hypothetical protein BLNAU_23612 [Blattamonas nauphoetae]